MKLTPETGSEHTDMMLSDLLEQVLEMKETLLSVQTSLARLESWSVKPLVQETLLTSADGLKRRKLRRYTTPNREGLTEVQSSQQSLSKQEESQ